MRKAILAVSVFALVLAGPAARAAVVTFDEAVLASGTMVTVDGLTLTASAPTPGWIGIIDNPPWTGLFVAGLNVTSGSYELAFSVAIVDIEIEIEALSHSVNLGEEQITGFATSNGAATITYTNQSGTSFDGSTITSDLGVGDGQGIIEYAGSPFTSFLFDHTQAVVELAGFVIERIVVTTDAPVSVDESTWSRIKASYR